jgi:two-component system, sensor histidine kinase and response regulator
MESNIMNQDTIASPKQAKILVVDDRSENLFAMKRILKAVDAEVVTAESGHEALSLLLRHEFAVIFLDVQMPEMDGFEVASLMRQNKQTAHIPIIFVTAISTEDKYLFEGYESGAVDYLFKPIAAEILQSKARIFCDMYGQRKELEVEIEARKTAEAANEKLISDLRAALEDVKTLRGIIPICSHCKKVRDDKGYWQQVEVYVQQHSEALFSHSVCLECMTTLYPEVAAKIAARKQQDGADACACHEGEC